MTPMEIVVVGIFGLMVGSFLNVCIARLPRGESIVTPASTCPSCRRLIAWRDNIPVLSYLWLRGRCRQCAAPISVRYPLVEAGTAVAFVVQAMVMSGEPAGVALGSRLVLTALLITLAVTDAETFRLPNPLTYGGLIIGVGLSFVAPPGVQDAILGALLGAGVLLAIREAWLRATGTDAMGLGDVKMLAMIGAFLGWPQVFVVLLLSTVVGAVVGVAVAASGGGSMRTKLPFGVFLAMAAYVASLVGDRLLAWYLGLLVV
ncbi:MAG: prepilin peptidase [Acidobacteria bacterium]|nr:prepilin peptidase [Acidobacteriota bacterium]